MNSPASWALREKDVGQVKEIVCACVCVCCGFLMHYVAASSFDGSAPRIEVCAFWSLYFCVHVTMHRMAGMYVLTHTEMLYITDEGGWVCM